MEEQVCASSGDQFRSSIGGSGMSSVGGAWNKRKKKFTAPIYNYEIYAILFPLQHNQVPRLHLSQVFHRDGSQNKAGRQRLEKQLTFEKRLQLLTGSFLASVSSSEYVRSTHLCRSFMEGNE
ncbi:hypothetical protein PIB30_030860 [Stylosanthes scabra]|uniref:Uncharacterized protein n=1 Tax=Stylosanthes scabra TaxID=79078 RepID=A0ABU6VAW9_9FABA|nr:hypothetical protein [Stylosanthes scabra]